MFIFLVIRCAVMQLVVCICVKACGVLMLRNANIIDFEEHNILISQSNFSIFVCMEFGM